MVSRIASPGVPPARIGDWSRTESFMASILAVRTAAGKRL
jgi:hypothetical protein